MKYVFTPFYDGDAIRFALPQDAVVSYQWETSDGQPWRSFARVPETLAANVDWITKIPGDVRQQGGKVTVTITAAFPAEPDYVPPVTV